MSDLNTNLRLAIIGAIVVYLVSLVLLSKFKDRLDKYEKYAGLLAVIACLGAAILISLFGPA